MASAVAAGSSDPFSDDDGRYRLCYFVFDFIRWSEVLRGNEGDTNSWDGRAFLYREYEQAKLYSGVRCDNSIARKRLDRGAC